MPKKKDNERTSFKGMTLIKEIYTDIRPQLLNIVSLVAGPTLAPYIDVKFYLNRASSYVRLWGRKKDRFLIVIGGLDIKRMAEVPGTITSVKMVYEVGAKIIKAVKAVLHHELAHILYSALDSREIIDYPKEEFKPFLQQTWNCLEDPFIEFTLAQDFKREHPFHENPKKFFDFLIQTIFIPMGKEYIDTGNQESFMEYLLLMYRIGEDKIAEENEVYSKYEEDLIPYLNDIMLEPDAYKRVHNVVVMCEWIINNVKEFNWEFPEELEPQTMAGSGAGGGVAAGGPRSGAPMKPKKQKKQKGSSEGGGGGSAPEPGEEEEKEEEEPQKEKTEEEGEGKETPWEGNPEGTIDHEAEADFNEWYKDAKDNMEEETEEESEEEDEEETEEDSEEDIDDEDSEETEDEDEDDDDSYSFDEELGDDFVSDLVDNAEHYEDNHIWFSAKDECHVPQSVIDDVDNVITKYQGLAQTMADYLLLCKGRIKPQRVEGLTKGRLSMRRAISNAARGGTDLKAFYRKMPRGKAVDLCSYILVDTSGSMRNQKSQLAYEACVITGQACEWGGIPVEISAFVHGNNSEEGVVNTTIVEKTFEDKFDDVKGFIALNNSNLYRKIEGSGAIGLFGCNEEEVNLWHIWQKLKKVDHQMKIVFVICDGMTCGSRAKLQQVIKDMENDNILVIGIGIMCHEVQDSYTHCRVFDSMEEIQKGLAPFILDTITEYSF